MTHMGRLFRRSYGNTHLRNTKNRKRVLLREFDLPLSAEKRDLLAERKRAGTILNGEHRDIRLVYSKKKVRVYAI